jgi:hypothetical protein
MRRLYNFFGTGESLVKYHHFPYSAAMTGAFSFRALWRLLGGGFVLHRAAICVTLIILCSVDIAASSNSRHAPNRTLPVRGRAAFPVTRYLQTPTTSSAARSVMAATPMRLMVPWPMSISSPDRPTPIMPRRSAVVVTPGKRPWSKTTRTIP